jgi:hypothetical protein
MSHPNKRRESGGQLLKNTAPHARAPGALSVYDGTTWVGSIAIRGDEFFAFNTAGNLLGSFKSQAEAMRSIPGCQR